jgi:hypothetical protein
LQNFSGRMASQAGDGTCPFSESPISRFAGSGWLFSWTDAFGMDAQSTQTCPSTTVIFGIESFQATGRGTGWSAAL